VDAVGAMRRRRGVADYRPSPVSTNVTHYPIASASTNTTSYLWGLDLSGTSQGAGGIGGLVAMIDDNANTYMPTYDANGNVTEYVDSGGNAVAHYAYDAYGNTINQSGAKADEFKFRFSTKYFDKETGNYNYGERIYAPRLGRFISEDPIGERGGLNLYGFCGNDPINKWDYLGMFSVAIMLAPPQKYCCIDGKKYLDKPIDTGAKICEARANSWRAQHIWLESPVGNIGVTAAEGSWMHIFYSTGNITDNEDYVSKADKICRPYKLSPCQNDFKKFMDYLEKDIKAYLAKEKTWTYSIVGCNACGSFVNALLNDATQNSRRNGGGGK